MFISLINCSLIDLKLLYFALVSNYRCCGNFTLFIYLFTISNHKSRQMVFLMIFKRHTNAHNKQQKWQTWVAWRPTKHTQSKSDWKIVKEISMIRVRKRDCDVSWAPSCLSARFVRKWNKKLIIKLVCALMIQFVSL